MRISTKHPSVRRSLVAGTLFSLLSLAACNSETSSVQEDLQVAEVPWTHPADTLDESRLPTQEQVGSTLGEMGYSKFEFIGKSVVVDGDMVLHQSDFVPSAPSETPALGKVAQRVKSLWEENRVSRHVTWRIYLWAKFPVFWRAAITNAISTWAEAAQFKFRITNNYFDADIRVLPSTILGPKIAAEASFPRVLEWGPTQYYGNGVSFSSPKLVAPGNLIRVNVKECKLYSLSSASSVMLHEFGHCFGFKHTNSNDGERVPGTPDFDPFSIMNTYNVDIYRGFSKNDLKAIQFMYPKQTLQNRQSGK